MSSHSQHNLLAQTLIHPLAPSCSLGLSCYKYKSSDYMPHRLMSYIYFMMLLVMLTADIGPGKILAVGPTLEL